MDTLVENLAEAKSELNGLFFLVKDFLPWRRNEQRNLNSVPCKSPVGNAEASDRRDDGMENLASRCDMFCGQRAN